MFRNLTSGKRNYCNKGWITFYQGSWNECHLSFHLWGHPGIETRLY